MFGRRKSGVFFADICRAQSQLFGNFTVPARTWSNHNIVTYKFQYLWHVWTLLVQGSESLLPNEQWFIEWSLAKNHIEFERGCKLPWTSSEGLGTAVATAGWSIFKRTLCSCCMQLESTFKVVSKVLPSCSSHCNTGIALYETVALYHCGYS